jgi:hypothetical protein
MENPQNPFPYTLIRFLSMYSSKIVQCFGSKSLAIGLLGHAGAHFDTARSASRREEENWLPLHSKVSSSRARSGLLHQEREAAAVRGCSVRLRVS